MGVVATCAFKMSDPRSDVNDIEDIAFSSRDDSKYNNRVLPRSLRKRGNKEELACESFIPGTHSVYVKTWGCTHNTSDGEYMAGLLAAKGYTILGRSNEHHRGCDIILWQTEPLPLQDNNLWCLSFSMENSLIQ